MNNVLLSSVLSSIKSEGYAKVDQLISGDEVSFALNELKLLRVEQATRIAKTTEVIKTIPKLDEGQEVIYNLQNKSLDLVKFVLGNSFITEVLCGTLNDQWHKAIPLDQPNYILRSYLARNNQVATPMHIDSYIPYQGDHALSIQVSIILEDQTAQNGCTILVPKSHQSGEYVTQDHRKDAVNIESKAGDVVFWDSRIWHGTNENLTNKTRWSLIATFVRWWIKQGYQITEQLPNEIYQSLNDAEKAVLGFCSRPFKDEFEGIDFKTGFSDLPKTL